MNHLRYCQTLSIGTFISMSFIQVFIRTPQLHLISIIKKQNDNQGQIICFFIKGSFRVRFLFFLWQLPFVRLDLYQFDNRI